MKAWLSGLFLMISITLMAQPAPDWWADLHGYIRQHGNMYSLYKYTQGYFGPNALPLPEISDARIAERHSFELSADAFWGDGDRTSNMAFHGEYIISDRASFSAWGTMLEQAQVTREVRDKRVSMAEDGRSFEMVGSIYFTTRIAIWQEQTYIPDIIANITMKTSSEKSQRMSRYFDTPGYYFMMESGKNLWQSSSAFLRQFRVVGNLGFLSYQMKNKYQNDAPIYAFKLKADFEKFSVEGLFGGYEGWLKDGDQHRVLRAKAMYHLPNMDCSLQYQYGVKDAAPHRLQAALRYYIGE